jgi:gamma-glutamyl:cysteine ligase YbdK (ATP-grasp superfamily)
VSAPLRLFEAYGIELEYMIVDRATLAVRPLADELLKAVTGSYSSDFEEGPVGWSNELVLHLIELKMQDPSPTLAGWAARFQADLHRIDGILAPLGARLLPTGMHPTMDPRTETRLWPHENAEIYAAYDAIFDCRRHGFANLQSCHLNLPFAGDGEFARLHTAVRAVLPLLPALAASSPLMDGAPTGLLDTRLEVYRTHQQKVPAAMGAVIPELVSSRAEYERAVFAPMYRQIDAVDPSGTLRHEFLNARGAIARFDRDAVEIRVLDAQETPRADLAIALLATAAVRAMCEERWVGLAELARLPVDVLAPQLWSCARTGERTPVADARLRAAFGVSKPCTAGELWADVARQVADRGDPAWNELGDALAVVLERGPLARRMLTRLGAAPDGRKIAALYHELADCLLADRLFAGP